MVFYFLIFTCGSVVCMNKFTLQHQVFLYDSYVKCKSTRKCQRKFRIKFPRVQVLCRNQNLVNEVRTIGMLKDRIQNIRVKY